MVELQVPFGMTPDGRIVTVETVGRGLDCNCQCPECNERLIAAKGAVYRHHFRHASDSECNGGPETNLHKLAKQVICETRTLAFVAREDAELFTASSATPEARLECGLIPDVLCEFSEPVAIEIWVAHQVPVAKIQTYNDEKIAALEIDLRSYRNAGHNETEWIKIIQRDAPRRLLSPTARIRAKREADRLAEIEHHRRIREEAERIEAEALAAMKAALEREEAARLEHQIAAAEKRALDQASAAIQRAKQEAEWERRRADDARRLLLEQQREMEQAAERTKNAEHRRAIAERLIIEREGPQLQQLVKAHGRYDLITPEAWKVWDHDLKTWQDRMATGWFRDETRRLLGV